MDYLRWNGLVAEHFFWPDMAGRRVHLYVTEELITELGSPYGADTADFVAAVKAGPPWATARGLCDKALESFEGWRKRELAKPPYLNYLALFVLAAGIEGNFASHAYYPRLRYLLGEEPVPGQIRRFDRMSDLWEDLERWSSEDTAGEQGIFKYSFAGEWINVGLPKAQTLLTTDERHRLPAVFAKAGLDPSSLPSDRALAGLLERHGRRELRQRTRQIMAGNDGDTQSREALTEAVLEELQHWDGTVDSEIMPSTDEGGHYGALRLCCRVDAIAGRVQSTMRCKSASELPEEGLPLSQHGSEQRYYCEDYLMGWSSPVAQEAGSPAVDAASWDWRRSLEMRALAGKWSFKLAPSPVRIFVSGATYGLPDLVETKQLPRNTPFYLAAHRGCSPLLERWGDSSCKNFRSVNIMSGLPDGWRLYFAEAAIDDTLVRSDYPVLAFPSTLQLSFDGGIKVSRSNHYFAFAPPRVVLRGGESSMQLYCNDLSLSPVQENMYELPVGLPAGQMLSVTARQDGQILRRVSLRLVEDFEWTDQGGRIRSDRFGAIYHPPHSGPAVTGALLDGVEVAPFNFSTTVVVEGARRIFLVGKAPGQIARLSDEQVPESWSPVWAIPMHRHGQAIFCGTGIMESEPVQSAWGDSRKVEQWKALLWYSRKRILPPQHKSLKKLWIKYQKEAARV